MSETGPTSEVGEDIDVREADLSGHDTEDDCGQTQDTSDAAAVTASGGENVSETVVSRKTVRRASQRGGRWQQTKQHVSTECCLTGQTSAMREDITAMSGHHTVDKTGQTLDTGAAVTGDVSKSEVSTKSVKRGGRRGRRQQTQTGEQQHEHAEYNCTSCSRSFSSRRDIVTHQYMHRENPTSFCAICNKSFSTEPAYRRHAASHNRKLAHRRPRKTCHQCDMQFDNMRELSMHHAGHHVDDKPFVCAICGSQFAWPENLKAHQRTHELDPHECDACGRRFVDATSLRVHTRNSHGPTSEPLPAWKQHHCKLCGRCFQFDFSLRAHMKGHAQSPVTAALRQTPRYYQTTTISTHDVNSHHTVTVADTEQPVSQLPLYGHCDSSTASGGQTVLDFSAVIARRPPIDTAANDHSHEMDNNNPASRLVWYIKPDTGDPLSENEQQQVEEKKEDSDVESELSDEHTATVSQQQTIDSAVDIVAEASQRDYVAAADALDTDSVQPAELTLNTAVAECQLPPPVWYVKPDINTQRQELPQMTTDQQQQQQQPQQDQQRQLEADSESINSQHWSTDELTVQQQCSESSTDHVQRSVGPTDHVLQSVSLMDYVQQSLGPTDNVQQQPLGPHDTESVEPCQEDAIHRESVVPSEDQVTAAAAGDTDINTDDGLYKSSTENDGIVDNAGIEMAVSEEGPLSDDETTQADNEIDWSDMLEPPRRRAAPFIYRTTPSRQRGTSRPREPYLFNCVMTNEKPFACHVCGECFRSVLLNMLYSACHQLFFWH